MTDHSPQVAAFLESVESRWLALLPGLLPHGFASKVLDGRANGKLAVEVSSATYFALIEAWSNAACLDVTVLDRATGKSTVLSAGSCADKGELDNRL